MKRKIRAGTTSLSLPVIVYDNTSTTGAGLSGITHASSGLVFEYRRQGQSSWTSVTPVSKTLGTYTSGGIVASGSRAGRYEIDIPDAAVAAGARFVEVCLRGVANMHPVDIEIELDAVDYQSATNFGLSKFADIETDTQDIQSRLPSALISGRMNATVGEFQAGLVPANFAALSIDVSGQINSVGVVDELGANALNANGLLGDIAIETWSQLTTYAWPADSLGKHILISNDNNRSVKVVGSGAGHVAADVHAIQSGVIISTSFDATAFTAIADGVLGRATSTSTYDAGDVGYVLRQIYSMIVADGADWQWSANSLDLAPAGGGGGGGTDWTANERIAIRSILGFNSSGGVVDPSTGVLDEIRDDIEAIGINVYPVSASTPERVSGTTLTFYRDESRSVSVVTDFTLTSLVLEFVVEDASGVDLMVVPNASISRSGQTFTVAVTTAVTSWLGNHKWSLRDITSGNSVIARGVLTVQDAASNG